MLNVASGEVHLNDGETVDQGGVPPVQVLLPVFNEARTIEKTLRELHEVIAAIVPIEFVVCEDGSTDGTRAVLETLAEQLPMRLVLGATRKGYSRAVIDGLRACSSPWVLCLDSDGQCDPSDFSAFWRHGSSADVVIGWRLERHDPPTRRALSWLFARLYRRLLRVHLRDPSCPFVLVSRPTLAHVLECAELGRLTQGFWWEFNARVVTAGFRCVELPIHHRARADGVTRVYRPWQIPEIGIRHTLGLLRIRSEIRAAGQALSTTSDQP